jgi:hypothetical protein
MKRLNIVPAVILSVLLLGCLLAAYMTRNLGNARVASSKHAADQTLGIDGSLLETARQMAGLAETSDEQDWAGAAVHLADHELDQAFATALRETAAYRAPLPVPCGILARELTNCAPR